MNPLILFGGLVGFFLGLIRYIWKMMKAEGWEVTIKKNFMWLDEEKDWWGYVFYQRHPIIALLSNTIIGTLMGIFAMVMLLW